MSISKLFLDLLENTDENQAFKEDIIEQPDLVNPQKSTFINDKEKIEVVPQKDGSKAYVFNKQASDFADGLLYDPADYTPIIDIFANAYVHDDDTAKLLDKANREDHLVFNTSKNGPIKISISDIFDRLPKMKRDERFEKRNNMEEAEEDWLLKWKSAKANKDQFSSIADYVESVQKSFNESFK